MGSEKYGMDGKRGPKNGGKNDTNTFESVGNVRFVDSTRCEADFLVELSGSGLIYNQSYFLVRKGGENSFFVNSDVSVRIPAPPLLTHVSFAPLNKLGISGLILFEGTDLEADKEYHITLEPSFSITIRISDSTSASSSPLLVGWNNSLPFSTTFKIASITPVDPMDGDLLNKSLLSFNTTDRPTELLIHLDSKSTDSSLFCGTFESPCPTIESGWKIVTGLSFARPTLGIIDSTTLSSQLTVSEGMHVLVTHGSNSEPTLTIPSSATHSEGSGLIVVTSASLEIVNVDIVLDSPLSSFVLLSASSSGLLLKDGTGQKTTLLNQKRTSTANKEDEEVNRDFFYLGYHSELYQLAIGSDTFYFVHVELRGIGLVLGQIRTLVIPLAGEVGRNAVRKQKRMVAHIAVCKYQTHQGVTPQVLEGLDQGPEKDLIDQTFIDQT
ncbi:hypothetical protein BLNAU_994 [Blattamonas nauphoetae]|uniref:Uncharacterized protein n=1 Tax=Blattamonas nauphoetae TaxID=2049346 RepID=A0ABQ9YJH5_9EUKA|nr:hypothetical protein BLNAU_994 [Blattamonas nauphoetae]